AGHLMRILASPPNNCRDATTSPGQDRYRLWLRIEACVERSFILFALYALSIGPLYWQWLQSSQVRGFSWLAAVYEPLLLLGEVFPLFGECLNWYIRLGIG